MYIFKEFNQTHAGLVRTSIILHLIAVAAVWGVAFLTLNDANAALITTLIVLLALHMLYIAYPTNAHDLILTRIQYLVTLCMAFTVTLMLLFAYSRSAAGVSGFAWETSSLFSFGLRLPQSFPSTLISPSRPSCVVR